MGVILFAVLVVTEKNHPHIEEWLLNLLGKSQRKEMTIYFPCDHIIINNKDRPSSYYYFGTK